MSGETQGLGASDVPPQQPAGVEAWVRGILDERKAEAIGLLYAFDDDGMYPEGSRSGNSLDAGGRHTRRACMAVGHHFGVSAGRIAQMHQRSLTLLRRAIGSGSLPPRAVNVGEYCLLWAVLGKPPPCPPEGVWWWWDESLSWPVVQAAVALRRAWAGGEPESVALAKQELLSRIPEGDPK